MKRWIVAICTCAVIGGVRADEPKPGKGTPEVAVNLRGEPIPQGDTAVYHAEGQVRVHVVGCRRLTTDPEELAKLGKMTLAEAQAKGWALCSRCPGSSTPGKGNPPPLPKSWVNPPPDQKTWKPEKTAYVAPESAPLISMGKDGRLVYRAFTDKGDKLWDYSYCGYRRSEVPIPDVKVVEILTPPEGKAKPEGNMQCPVGPDSLATIQAAIDRAAAMKPENDGFRGAVLLKKGTWYLGGELVVRPGVVLRGEGDGADGTVLVFTIPDGQSVGIRVGAVSTQGLKPLTGDLTKGKTDTGEDAYFLVLEDGFKRRVNDPRFRPELKLEPFVGSRVTCMMKCYITDLGTESFSRLKHDMPYEVKRVDESEAVPPNDPNCLMEVV